MNARTNAIIPKKPIGLYVLYKRTIVLKTLIPSEYVEDLSDAMDEYPYIKEDFTVIVTSDGKEADYEDGKEEDMSESDKQREEEYNSQEDKEKTSSTISENAKETYFNYITNSFNSKNSNIRF